jgi:hypothetical protein
MAALTDEEAREALRLLAPRTMFCSATRRRSRSDGRPGVRSLGASTTWPSSSTGERRPI